MWEAKSSSLSPEQAACGSVTFMHFALVTVEFCFPTVLRTELKCIHHRVGEDRRARAQPSLGEESCLI